MAELKNTIQGKWRNFAFFLNMIYSISLVKCSLNKIQKKDKAFWKRYNADKYILLLSLKFQSENPVLQALTGWSIIAPIL